MSGAGEDAVGAWAGEALRQGSKSFNVAALLLDPETRESATLLYAWCRHLDDQVDGQVMGHDAAGARAMVIAGPDRDRRLAMLERMRAATIAAHRGKEQSDPVFESFRRVASRHAIPLAEPLALLDGFAMDVEGRRYERFTCTLDYCWHVAGVVGVMMGRVLGVRDEATLDRACDLGLAFQLTNIARDIMDDWRAGRCYLPADWLDDAGLDPARLDAPEARPALAGLARRLVAQAEPYYASARIGLAALPPRSAWAIGTARGVYRAIGHAILREGEGALQSRAVVPRRAKAGLALAAGLGAVGQTLRRAPPRPRPAGLWSRPC